jgi:Tfp pilus assembly protein PilE
MKLIHLIRMSFGLTPARFPIANDNTLDPKLSHYCAPKHWDPTMVYRYTVPEIYGVQALPMDPRPWTKICLQYVNSGPAEYAPAPPSDMVFTGAGTAKPPTRYLQAIDSESQLRRLDRPLNNDLLTKGQCRSTQYTLPQNSDALQQYVLLPPQTAPQSSMARELADPAVLERNGQYKCSEEAMICSLKGAPRYFLNATKQNRYNQTDNKCGSTLWQRTDGQNPRSKV